MLFLMFFIGSSLFSYIDLGGLLRDYFVCLQDTPDTIPEPLFCGSVMDVDVPKCMLHRMTTRKCVAFEGASTGRRFYGCSVQVSKQADLCVICMCCL